MAEAVQERVGSSIKEFREQADRGRGGMVLLEAELLEQAMDGYRRFQLLKTAVDSGLFSWLREHGAASSHRIVDAMRWSGHFGQAVLHAMVEEGWLGAAGNRLQCSLSAEAMQQASHRFAELQTAWERLPALLPAASTAPRAVADRNAAWRGSRNAALEREQVQAAVQSWAGLPAARRLLDLGGTEGQAAMALCATNPQLHAEVLVERGRRAAVQARLIDARLEQRITLSEHEIGMLDLQGTYDVVLALHCFYPLPQAVLQTMETVAFHMQAGGLFVSQHWFEDGRGVAGQGAARLIERRILQSRAPLHYPDAYADRISSAGLHVLRVEGGVAGINEEYATWLHVAERAGA